jgi:hypothetical protein
MDSNLESTLVTPAVTDTLDTFIRACHDNCSQEFNPSESLEDLPQDLQDVILYLPSLRIDAGEDVENPVHLCKILQSGVYQSDDYRDVVSMLKTYIWQLSHYTQLKEFLQGIDGSVLSGDLSLVTTNEEIPHIFGHYFMVNGASYTHFKVYLFLGQFTNMFWVEEEEISFMDYVVDNIEVLRHFEQDEHYYDFVYALAFSNTVEVQKGKGKVVEDAIPVTDDVPIEEEKPESALDVIVGKALGLIQDMTSTDDKEALLSLEQLVLSGLAINTEGLVKNGFWLWCFL